MNIVWIIVLCLVCLLVGYELGNWQEIKNIRQLIEDISDQHAKEIKLLVDKIMELKKKGE